jgi:predicted transcriptional regulator
VRQLGQLEAKVMKVLWDAPAEPMRVRDVMDRLQQEPARAYTTIMTVLDNLHRKGWTTRRSDGRGYRYQPAQAREEVAAKAMRELLDSVDDTEAVLLNFARDASDEEVAALRKALRRRARRTGGC